MNYTDRIDGFQIRDLNYIGLPPKNTPPGYDVVKWVQTEPRKVISFETMKEETITEYCYSVAHLVWNRKEPCFEFNSIGLRWLEANPTQAVIDMVLKFAEEKAKELEENDEAD